MIILSDDKNAAKFFLGNDISETIIDNKSSKNLRSIIETVFTTQDFNSFSSEELTFWKYLLINDYSKSSQFDDLISILRNNIELPDRLLLLAARGENFHGFRNRSWKAEKGNIHLTLHFKPHHSVKNIHAGLLLVAANAVILTLDQISGMKGKAKSKWVNDVIIENSKISGIITQSFSSGNNITGAVIGIGLNVLKTPEITSDRFTNKSVSVSDFFVGDDINVNIIFRNLLKNLEKTIMQLENNKYEELLNFYCNRSGVLGKEIEIYVDNSKSEDKLICRGKLKSIEDNLELVVEGHPDRIRSGRLALVH